jgi:hypothetical protein
MPLQPPNPEFLSQAPGPKPGFSDAQRAGTGRFWRRTAGATGLVAGALALLLGAPELLI